jgi:hypothetical protein
VSVLCKGVFSRTALPFDQEEENSSQIIVEFKGEKGNLYFDLIWRDSKIVGLGVDLGAPELSTLFLSVSSRGNEFAGYYLDMARNFQINFLVNEDGQITGLTISNDDAPIQALESN